MVLVALTAYLVLSAGKENWTDRATFWRAMSRVRDGATKAQVKSLLGEPDDVVKGENDFFPGSLTWAYGTNGHKTLATLGHVVFRNDRVVLACGGWERPPAQRVIGEVELRSALRRLDSYTIDKRSDSDQSLFLIRAANLLISKGKSKAVAILREYSRIHEFWEFRSSALFWLTRVAFVSNKPGGVFPTPRIGAITPAPPDNLRSWPTFPVLFAGDIPISLFRGATLGGFPEPFFWYLDAHAKEWNIRTKPLRPADDPFEAFLSLQKSPAWPFPTTRGKGDKTDENEERAMEEILALVKNVVTPTEPSLPYTLSLFDRLHREFLAHKGHWNAKQQRYESALMRADS